MRVVMGGSSANGGTLSWSNMWHGLRNASRGRGKKVLHPTILFQDRCIIYTHAVPRILYN